MGSGMPTLTKTIIPLVVAALATVGLSIPAGAVDPDHVGTGLAGTSLKVIESNIGSGTECVYTDANKYCLAKVEEKIADWSPDAVALVEVCAAVRDKFKSYHPGWDVAFRELTHEKDGCGGQAKGQMVAAPNIERTDFINLSGDIDVEGETNDKFFGAVCADIGDAWVCATHLIADWSDAGQATKVTQVKELKKGTIDWSKVAIAGDFNMSPENAALDVLENNDYTEADEAQNEPTSGDPDPTVKFDYVWFHKVGGQVGSTTGWVVPQPTSHHELLKGLVNW
jgi:hypothetical protein